MNRLDDSVSRSDTAKLTLRGREEGINMMATRRSINPSKKTKAISKKRFS